MQGLGPDLEDALPAIECLRGVLGLQAAELEVQCLRGVRDEGPQGIGSLVGQELVRVETFRQRQNPQVDILHDEPLQHPLRSGTDQSQAGHDKRLERVREIPG